MSGSPGFKLYANDWLASTDIALMTPAEEGALIRLLCHQWKSADGTLPDDDGELSILSRLGEGWFGNASSHVRKCFKAHPTKQGRIYNRRLEEERKKQTEWKKKSATGGIKSGKSRRSASKGGSTKHEAVHVEPNANMRARDLSFSSSLSEEKQNPSPAVAGDEKIPAAQKASANGKARHEPDARHNPIRQEIFRQYAEHNSGLNPPWDGSEAGQLGKLLKAVNWPLESFVTAISNRFKSEQPKAERPCKWIGSLTSYLNGPLDRFGKPFKGSVLTEFDDYADAQRAWQAQQAR